MAEKIKHKLDDFPDELFFEDDLGTVVDLDKTTQNPIWIGIGFSSLIIIVFLSWAYLYITKTPEDILNEKLRNYRALSEMRENASKPIKADLVKSKELTKAIKQAIDITNTPLRMSQHPLIPYVPERQLAMIDALDGLLRAELEGHLDMENPKDRDLFLQLLNSLGNARLEYYEDGLLQRVPLLESSRLRKEILDEKYQKQSYSSKEIQLLENELRNTEQKESTTVLAAAFLLGKWYRYYNEMDLASACFEIGRKYVDGYVRANTYYQGKRPKDFSPVWKEYVGCLEALTEIALEKKKYRQARSYLVRIFNTPNNVTAFLLKQSTQNHLEKTNQEIREAEEDLVTIQEALSSPKSLTSFPFFHLEDGNIDWKLFFERLKLTFLSGSPEDERSLEAFIWNKLDPSMQTQILNKKGVQWLSTSNQNELVDTLNIYIKDPSLFQLINYNKSVLSEQGQKILKSSQADLSIEDISLVNREIFNQVFPEEILNRFILNDGTSINNSLSERQLRKLISIYQEEIDLKDTGPKRKEELSKLIEKIHEKKIHPRLPDLQKALTEKESRFLDLIKEGERIYDIQRGELRQLKDSLEDMESQGNINVSKLQEIKKNEEIARNRQYKAEIQTKEAQKELVTISNSINEIYTSIYKKQGEIQRKLEGLKERQANLRIQTVNESEPLLEQIQTQIVLRKKYLRLLSSLYEKNEGQRLKTLRKEQKELEKQILDLRSKILTSKGNEREKLQEQTDTLENAQHKIIEEFNNIFSPIRQVIREIAQEEEKVWQAQDLLKETQQKILRIVGTNNHHGSLKEKTLKRARLLLIQPKNEFERQHYIRETQNLNGQIAQEHAELNVLLQTESLTKQTLQTLNPRIGDIDIALFDEKSLATLKQYLQKQDSLMGEYSALWKQNHLLDRIYSQEETIVEHFQSIAESLQNNKELSEEQTNQLSRYMRNIIQASSKLNHYRLILKQLKISPHIKSISERPFQRGYHMDEASFFAMERKMHLNITQYRKAFEERSTLVQELLRAIQDKNELEKQQAQAVFERDQVQFDLLVPKIVEAENRIFSLNEHAVQINQHLQGLADQYAREVKKVTEYRKRLFPKLKESERRIDNLSHEMARNDTVLDQLTQQIISGPKELNRVITKLDIEDLDQIESLIEELKREIHNLSQAQGIKQKENFYKTKALWLIGKSAFLQSQLNNFADLIASNDISTDIVEDENRNGKIIFQEYDDELVYSEKLFFGSSDIDENTANYQTWIDFLEKYAARIFSSEIPKYMPKNISGEIAAFDYAMQQDNKVYIARSRFLLGKIHLRRALRFVRSSTDNYLDNDRTQQELNFAMSSLLSFLDFSKPLMDKTLATSPQLTGTEDSSQEFPHRSRKPLNLLNDARILIASIAYLQGDYNKSIQFNRTILEDIARDSNPYRKEENPSEPFDPISASLYEYDTSIHPFYHSLLSSHILSHEVLYRMGKSYQALADQEFSLKYSKATNRSKANSKEHFQEYANKAIHYYSQLILTHSYSPYRKAALLQRALLKKQLKQYQKARNDLIAILGSPYEKGGSFELKDITEKGDLPGELNPGYSHIIFELGKLYFENKDYLAAADSFLKAQELDEEGDYILKAQVSYAKALVASKKWIPAYNFLTKLIEQPNATAIDNPYLYEPDLLLHLGVVKKELSLFNESLLAFKNIFAFAPAGLYQEERFDTSNVESFNKLITDYRDTIRPIAYACLHSADIYLQRYDFNNAKYYYLQAEKLFRMISREEDKVLKHLNHQDFDTFRQEHILKSRWGQLKTDVQELMYSTLARFRKVIGVDLASGVLALDELQQEINITLNNAEDQKGSYEKITKVLKEFRQREVLRLPEQMEHERIVAQRQADRELGTLNSQRYDALTSLRNLAIPMKHIDALSFIVEIDKQTVKGSLQDQMINDFVVFFIQNHFTLTEKDRQAMLPANRNINNIQLIPQSQERLVDFSKQFIAWVEMEMRKTGLDDLFLPVSPQASVIEDIDHIRISLLAFLDSYQSYTKMLNIVDFYLDIQQTHPNRITYPIKIWEMVEIGSYNAEARKDWKKVEQYNRYLLSENRKRYFIQKNQGDRYRAKMGLAKALIHLADGLSKDIPFIENTIERRRLQESIDKKNQEAYQILQDLIQIKGNDTAKTTTRILAKELLYQLDNNLI